MFRYIIKLKYMNLLVYLQDKETTTRQASINCDMVYYRLIGIINHFVNEGLITKTKRNKNPTAYISLSQKGKQAVYHLQQIKKIMEEN